MEGEWYTILRATVTAIVGVYLLAASLTGWFLGPINILLRLILGIAALMMIEGGLVTDLVGAGLVAVVMGLRTVMPGSRKSAPARS